MTRRHLLPLALPLALATALACKEQAQTNSLPTIRLGAVSVAPSAAVSSTAALVDRDTTTTVRIASPTSFTLTLPHAAEVRRIKIFAVNVRVEADGADALVRDGSTGESWAATELVSPVTTDHLTVTVTPIGAGAHVSEIELWGAGLPQAPRDVQALAEATKSVKAAFEDAVVLRATPASATLRPGSTGPTCLDATLPASSPRGARRAYLVYESTAPRAVVLTRSVDAQAAVGGFWLPPATETRTLVDEIDPERLTGQADTVSLCLPDDATDAVTISGLRLVLVLDDGTDVFAREAHERWAKIVDGDPSTDLGVSAGRMELALDRPTAIDGAALQLGAAPARLSSVGVFDGNAWSDQAGLDLPQQTAALPLSGHVPQAAQLTFSGTARTDVPAALVSEVQLSGSGVGPRVGVARIVLTYPAIQHRQDADVGERFGDRAYVSGWAESPAGAGTIEIDGAPVGVNGAFGTNLVRPAGATTSGSSRSRRASRTGPRPLAPSTWTTIARRR